MRTIDTTIVQQRIADTSDQFLKIFSFTLIGMQLVIMLVTILIGAQGPWGLGTVGLFGSLVSIGFIYRGQMQIARWISTVPVFVSLFVWPFGVSGAKSPAIAYYACLILFVGWIYGRRRMLLVASIFGALIVAMVFIQSKNLWVFPIAERTSETWGLAWIASITYLTLAMWFLLRTVETLLFTETRLRGQLDEANERLKSELVLTTEALEHSDETLGHVQKEFEKAYPMANMAAVVPGVAHDLSTPVGNTNMAVTTLRDHLERFEEKVVSGNLRKTDLSGFLESIRQGLGIVETANSKVADLVASLKEMSIDQASQRRRQFELGMVIRDIVSVMAPSVKKAHAKIDIDVDPLLVMDSYPGPLGQILTNLIQNTLVHAFDGRENGTIAVRGHMQERSDRVQICVEDNGAGMSEEVLGKIFEPYFTTKLGRGGSGVGLALCKQLTHDVLCGTLSVSSTLGEGSKFILELPLSASLKIDT